MSTFHGIQVYEILENGNLLNAIYTNTGLSNTVDNEIARKKLYDNNGVVGNYDCSYIQSNEGSAKHYDLEISKHNSVYEFTWKPKQIGQPTWKGIGLMSGTTHIAVSYVEV